MLLEWFDFRAFLLFLLVFVPLEFLLPIHEKARIMRRGWVTDVLHFFFSGIVIRIGMFGFVVLGAGLGTWFVPASIQTQTAALAIWVQVPLAVIIADLGFYLAHRLMHTSPLLWKFHAVHHSSEEMDWLAAFRVHPVDQIFVKGSSLAPIFVLGFSDLTIAIAGAFYLWHSLILHSNIRVPLGPLRWLLASPEFHHWHHANQRDVWDKNFSGQLPLWDLVFGTAHMPGRMPETYGVDEEVPEGYVGQLTYPFTRDVAERAGGEGRLASSAGPAE